MANVTITMDEATLRWVRIEAAKAGVSVSRYVGQVLMARRAETENAPDQEARDRAKRMEAIEKFLALAVHVPDDRPDWTFDRDEIYDRPYPGGHERDPVQSGPRWPSAQTREMRGVAEAPERYEHDDRKPAGDRRNPRQRRSKT
jgi:hypothetical protein